MQIIQKRLNTALAALLLIFYLMPSVKGQTLTPGNVSPVYQWTNKYTSAPKTIISQPATLTGCVGIDCISYQWQKSTNGTSWTDITDAVGLEYNPGAFEPSVKTYNRLKITGASQTVYSAVCTTEVQNEPVSGPVDVWQGETATYYYTSGSGGTYSWDFSTGSATVVAGSLSSPSVTLKWLNTGTNTLTITNNGTVRTLKVYVHNDPLNPGIIPVQTYSIEQGSSQVISPWPLNATGGNCLGVFTYQWQQSTDGSNFTNISGQTSPDITVTPTAKLWYRRQVTCGSTIAYTNATTVSLYPYLNPGTISRTGGTVAWNTDTEIQGTLPTGGLTDTYLYQWEISGDGSVFYPITANADGLNYATSGGLTSSVYFRRKVTNGVITRNSNALLVPVELVVFDPGILTPVIKVITNGSTQALTGTAANGGTSASYSYQWQQSYDEVNWSNCVNGTSPNFTTPSLTRTTYYRRFVTNQQQSGYSYVGGYLNIIKIKVVGTATSTNKPTTTTQPQADPSVTERTVDNYVYSGLTDAKLNYVRSWDVLKPGVATANAAKLLTNNYDVRQNTAYFDDLGRDLQTVSKTASAAEKDIVTVMNYDVLGRLVQSFLPYADGLATGSIRLNASVKQPEFYNTRFNNTEGYYYNNTVYENAPSNRPIKQTQPGKSWTGSNVGVRTDYTFNSTQDDVKKWQIAAAFGSIPVINGSYPAGSLALIITTDEHENKVLEYKDKDGKVILKKVQIGEEVTHGYTGWLSTYYIYDEFDRLRYVIPPKAVEQIIASSWTIATEVQNELCFMYGFDERGRMTQKKVPGSGVVDMVYDQRDRLVFVQDANSRVKTQWLVNRYDHLNRQVWTGLMETSDTRAQLQQYVNLNTGTGVETQVQSNATANVDMFVYDRVATPVNYSAKNSISFLGEYSSLSGSDEIYAVADGGLTGYFIQNVTDDPVPPNLPVAFLTKSTYYDDWTLSTSPISFPQDFRSQLNETDINNPTAENIPASPSIMVRGMLKTTLVRVLETNGSVAEINQGAFLAMDYFYDDKGRVSQLKSQNLKDGYDVVSTRYNFIGAPLATYLSARNPANRDQPYTLKTNYSYDHAGRLKEVWKTVNDAGSKILIAKNEYDELGQLKQKSLGRKKNAANEYLSEPLETLDYEYNIRGWLKTVNKDYANKNGTNANNRWFGMELNYDWGFDANQFNGNIAGTKWRSKGDGEQRAFGYGYDAADRILFADFNQLKGSAWGKVAASGSGYTVNIDFSVLMGNGIDPAQAYDANGNILRMKQYGLKLNSSPLIDDLEYTYYANSNKLKSVKDHQNDPTTSLGDFRSSALYMSSLGGTKTIAATDYTYDANGNLTKDLNKDIGDAATEGIEYNHLNLPFKITVKNANGTKGTITYIYDAAGNKLEKRVQDNTNAAAPYKNTTYIGPFVYESDKLQFISHEEGRIREKDVITTQNNVCDPPDPPQPGFECPPPTYTVTKGYVFDYFIKDHLGNVRMVLTEEVQKDIYPIASLENTEAVNVEKAFYNIDGVNIVDKSAAMQIPDYANNNGIPSNNSQVTEGNMSQRLYRLNGNVPGSKMGLGITLKVMAGDQVDIMAKSYWKTADGNVAGTPSAIDLEGLLTNFVGNGIANKQGITGPLLNSAGGITSMLNELLNGQSQTSTRPKAYLNWILFDENFRPVTGSGHTNSGFDAVGTNGELKPHTKSTGEITKNGYLYIYCSNESRLDVFFDNLQVIHTRGALLEETHYYPFGLMMAGISSKATKGQYPINKFGFNGGNELQFGEFSDGSGLQMYDAVNRMYDPQLGRFSQVDELAEAAWEWSPYSFGYNSPINFNDPLGLEAENSKQRKRDYDKRADGNTQEVLATVVVKAAHSRKALINTYWLFRNSGRDFKEAPKDIQRWMNNYHQVMLHMEKVYEMTREGDEVALEIGSWFLPTGALLKVKYLSRAAKLFKLKRGKQVAKAAEEIGEQAAKHADEAAKGVTYTKSSLKLGQQMHKAYKAGLDDGINTFKEFRLPSGKRIDFLDVKNGIIYELKPFNPRAMKAGEKQLQIYMQELQNMPQFKGINWKTVLDTY